MSISGFKEVAYVDCEGGGQMYVDGTTAYIGHMDHPLGTGIYDVADPKNVRLLAQLDIPEGMHSHKVRVVDGLMLINHERARGVPETDTLAPGIGIYERFQSRQTQTHHQLGDGWERRTPLRFRRALRLPLRIDGRLQRPHRRHLGPQGPGAA